MRRVRQSRRSIAVVGFVTAAIVLAQAAPASADGYGPYAPYQGSKFPTSASVFTSIHTVRSAPRDYEIDLEKFGGVLDVDGDGRADVGDFADYDVLQPTSVTGGAYPISTLPSPYDPNVLYAIGLVVEPIPADESPYEICTFVRGETAYRLVRKTRLSGTLIPKGPPDAPPRLRLVGVRRGPTGTDEVLLALTEGELPEFQGFPRPNGPFPFHSRWAVYVDSADSDSYPDHVGPVAEAPDVYPAGFTPAGDLLVLRISDHSYPYRGPRRYQIVTDSGLAGRFDAYDDTRIVESPSLPVIEYEGATDLGADRFLAPVGATLLLDSRGVPRRVQQFEHLGSLDFYPVFSYSLRLLPDGSPATYAYSSDLKVNYQRAAYVHTDGDFDGWSLNSRTLVGPSEVNPIARQEDFPPFYSTLYRQNIDAYLQSVATYGLTRVDTSSGGGEIRFADFGEFPGGETFKFRFGSRDYDAIWVGRSGLVSVAGPVGPEATLAGLERTPGTIAACHSDAWDAEHTSVFAGYAPVQKSFRTGERVLAFVVEWRGLRRPEWEARRQIDCRMVLFSDGTWRVDYGSFGADDIGPHPFVAGYSGLGNGGSPASLDLSEHSFGRLPCDATGARVAAEVFDDANPTDLDHLWVRFDGFPEALTTLVTPAVVDPVVKKGDRIVLSDAGSGLADGARLVVDGVEAFRLAKISDGSKWTVGPRATSYPSGRTIAELFGDGLAHRVMVVDPSGVASATVELTR